MAVQVMYKNLLKEVRLSVMLLIVQNPRHQRRNLL